MDLPQDHFREASSEEELLYLKMIILNKTQASHITKQGFEAQKRAYRHRRPNFKPTFSRVHVDQPLGSQMFQDSHDHVFCLLVWGYLHLQYLFSCFFRFFNSMVSEVDGVWNDLTSVSEP
jgi:hypothetical protein